VPMPGTPTFQRWQAEGRILTTDWSKYDGKKHCVFRPARMSPEELVAGTEWASRRFYSLRSIARRMWGSRVGVWWNLPRNLGYHLALRRYPSRGGTPALTGRAGDTLTAPGSPRVARSPRLASFRSRSNFRGLALVAGPATQNATPSRRCTGLTWSSPFLRRTRSIPQRVSIP